MAIFNGIGSNLRGSAGNWTFTRLAGQTIAKQKVNTKGTSPRTFAQMVRRVAWANIVNMWRAFEGLDRPSFEGRDPRHSDFNEFMGANLDVVPVFLDKEEARAGGCVAAPYQVTRGSLPSIGLESGDGGVVKTSVQLGDLVIGSNTTVAEFSNAVLTNNRDFAAGDNITVFVVHQLLDAATGVPRVEVSESNVTLDPEDSVTLLFDTAMQEAFSTVDGVLGMSGSMDGAVVYIHSRKTASGTAVSTQRLLAKNAILASYQTATKRDEAIASYGGKTQPLYLTPNGNDVEVQH